MKLWRAGLDAIAVPTAEEAALDLLERLWPAVLVLAVVAVTAVIIRKRRK